MRICAGRAGSRAAKQKSPGEQASVNLCRFCGLVTGSRILPNEANLNLCVLYGLKTRERKLPNEANLNLCGLCGHIAGS